MKKLDFQKFDEIVKLYYKYSAKILFAHFIKQFPDEYNNFDVDKLSETSYKDFNNFMTFINIAAVNKHVVFYTDAEDIVFGKIKNICFRPLSDTYSSGNGLITSETDEFLIDVELEMLLFIPTKQIFSHIENGVFNYCIKASEIKDHSFKVGELESEDFEFIELYKKTANKLKNFCSKAVVG